nr:putative ribonuclease H-like domain-containing protein [Tanacetum cinerariifolium]
MKVSYALFDATNLFVATVHAAVVNCMVGTARLLICKLAEIGSGPTWLFDIDTFTQSMNYQLVVTGNQPNFSASIQEHFDADLHNADADTTFEVKEPESKVHVCPSSSAKSKKHDDKTKREAKGKITAVEPNSTNSTNTFSVAGPSNNVVSLNFKIGGKSSFVDPFQYLDDPNMPALKDINYSDDAEDVGAEADFSNLETNITISPIPITRVHKDHPVSQIIGDLSSAPLTRKNLAACKVGKETKSSQQYVLLPLWSFGSQDPQNTDANDAFDVKENENEVHVSLSSSDKPKKHDDKAKIKAKGKRPVDLSTGVRDLRDEFKEFFINNSNRVNAASAPVTAVGLNPTISTNNFNVPSPSDNVVSLKFSIGGKSSFMDPSQYPDDPDMPALEDIVYSDDDEDVVAETRSMVRMVKEQDGLNQIIDEDFHTCMFACFLSQEEPKRVHQALKDPSWIKSMQEELL